MSVKFMEWMSLICSFSLKKAAQRKMNEFTFFISPKKTAFIYFPLFAVASGDN